MRLASVRIQNFRAFADETIQFNDYTCLVGPNGGGKSTILTALNSFFRQTGDSPTDLLRLDIEDFHHRNTKEPITITVTFDQFGDEEQKDFKDYCRHGKLVVSAVAKWDEGAKCAEVLQYGERLGMEDFKPFFRAEGDNAAVSELKKLYVAVKEKHSDLPAPGSKQAMIDALHQYEAARPEACKLILSEDQFYGVSRGANLLQKYIQWIFVPAVKDASTEQLEGKKTALGMLLERTVRAKVSFAEPIGKLRDELNGKYQALLDGQQGALSELSKSLNARIQEWAHPDTSLALQWQNETTSIKITEPLAQVVAGEGEFKGKLPRFGHGLQRSFLLALLQELAGADDDKGPRLILGCEEPELFQHPPQARHLSAVFQKLSTKKSQVITCTHSPYFVSGRGFEDIRAIRQDAEKKSSFSHHVSLGQLAELLASARGEPVTTPSGTLLKVQQALQPALNEIFFTNVLVLVEGQEDLAYISTYLTLLNLWDEFRRLGCHIVPADKKSCIAKPLAIANHLKIPTFVVFDSDAHKPDKNGSRTKHQKDNTQILKLCGIAAPDPLPTSTLWAPNVVMWKNEIRAIVAEEIGSDDLAAINREVREKHDLDTGDFHKNILFIGYLLMEAWDKGKKCPSLERLCKAILEFAAASRKMAGNSTPAVAPANASK